MKTYNTPLRGSAHIAVRVIDPADSCRPGADGGTPSWAVPWVPSGPPSRPAECDGCDEYAACGMPSSSEACGDFNCWRICGDRSAAEGIPRSACGATRGGNVCV